jgi:hypothetical protein
VTSLTASRLYFLVKIRLPVLHLQYHDRN